MYNQFSDISFCLQENNHSFYDFFEQDLDYSIYNIKDVLRQRLALLCILTLKDYEERALNYEWN